MKTNTAKQVRSVRRLFVAGFVVGVSAGFAAAVLEPSRLSARKPSTAARMRPPTGPHPRTHSKRYGAVEALRGLDLEIAEGEAVGRLVPTEPGRPRRSASSLG